MVNVQKYLSGESGIFSNAYLVETSGGMVAVDSTLSVSGGRALNGLVRKSGKPLLAVLLTHGHPDHYNGVAELISGFPNVPVVSTKAVDAVIRKYDEAKEKQWKPVFGAEWPAARTFPNRIASDNETLAFGNVSFTVHDLGPGESHADSYWMMEYEEGGRSVREAFIGDVVLHKVHAYLADGHSTEWLRNIAIFMGSLKDCRVLYPGHGEPGGLEILEWQKAYLDLYRKNVKLLSKGSPSLTDDAKQQLAAEMKKFLSNSRLEFLIPLGADPVAAELAG